MKTEQVFTKEQHWQQKSVKTLDWQERFFMTRSTVKLIFLVTQVHAENTPILETMLNATRKERLGTTPKNGPALDVVVTKWYNPESTPKLIS